MNIPTSLQYDLNYEHVIFRGMWKIMVAQYEMDVRLSHTFNIIFFQPSPHVAWMENRVHIQVFCQGVKFRFNDLYMKTDLLRPLEQNRLLEWPNTPAVIQ